MKVRFLDAARAELVEAVRHYNREREGLGFEFAAEVRRAVLRIVEFPEAWTPYPTGQGQSYPQHGFLVSRVYVRIGTSRGSNIPR